jgi:hypothetical protein
VPNSTSKDLPINRLAEHPLTESDPVTYTLTLEQRQRIMEHSGLFLPDDLTRREFA